MNTVIGPLALIIGSVVLYQVSTKLLPRSLNPWHALLMYYALAFGLTLVATVLDRPSKSLLESLRDINWAVPLVALSIVGIEVGWILVLRAGSPLSLTGLIVNVAVAVVVIPLGLLVFHERINQWNLAGIALCLLGLVLISKR